MQRYFDGTTWTEGYAAAGEKNPKPPPGVEPPKQGIPRPLLILGAALGLIVVISIANKATQDEPSETASQVTSSSSRPSTSAKPRTWTMNPLPGKAYKIDDCFLCSEPPGTWETTGAIGGETCRWVVQADLTQDINSIIDTGTTGPNQPTRVALKVGQFFTSTNCGVWRFIG
ncbi:MAG: hypothetical protein JHC55_00750 [Mycolicibacterium sp.]|nr:hypothetical protein [Mycolicibacterium sp.]